METESELSQFKEPLSALSGQSLNSIIMDGVIQSSDGNSTECREATKNILEDVCMDFESMDVINPKSNKIIVVPKSRPDSSQQSASIHKKVSSTSTVSTIVHSTNMLDMQNKSNPLSAVGNILLHTVSQNETGSSDITLEQSENDLLQQSYCAAVGHTTGTIEANSEMGLSDNLGNISFVSSDFSHNENIPSMAQLADAEIIQTDENSVSIIITNPRLIKVMTNADNSLSSAMASASMIDPSASILESAIGASEQMGIDSGGISTFKIEDIGLSDNTSVLNNIFVETEGEISNVEISNTEISNTEVKAKRNKVRPYRKKVQPRVPVKGTGRGKAPKLDVVPKALHVPPPPPRAATGTTTKARRITAKMKEAWAKQLQKTGCLVCHLPGCSQTYVTVANFATHYKYCTGKKNLQHCLYCDSLIFSSNKAVLQHMEVEHPEKVEEYKAKYPQACTEYDEGSLPSHLIVAEDENVAMNVVEVTQPQKKKRKLSKENVLSPPKAILKQKMKCINESVNENIKEFKKCVRFDNIVDKINSVDEFSNIIQHVSEIKPPKKEKKKRVYVTGKIVAEKEYFEDDDDDIPMSQEEQEEAKNREMMHTKARMVLNLERYKRYKEYLKLTRDWSSERKTYSRSRGSDTSLDNSYLRALQNEYMQDIHQLHAAEEPSTNISLDISQTSDSQLETTNDLSSIQTFEVIQTDKFVSVQPIRSSVRSNVTSTPISRFRDEGPNNLSLNLNEISSVAIDLPASAYDRTKKPSSVVNRERVPCYNRPIVPGNVACKIETPRPKRFGSAITFGITVPPPVPKPPEPIITFDTLINLSQKQVKKNSQVSPVKIVGVTAESTNNHLREDGIKHPADLVDGKRKRGKTKHSLDSVSDAKTSQNKRVIGKNKNSKKDGSAVLKSIKNNAINRNAKLLKLKKTSKLKCDSKKIIRISQLRTNRLNMRNTQLKHSHGNLASINNSLQDPELKKPEEESVIQCVENIDNHVSLSGSISQIQCFTVDHNYSHPSEVCAVDPVNNVAGEVEIISSSADVEADNLNIDANTCVEESSVVQPVTINLDTQEVETADNSAPSTDLQAIPSESSKDSQELRSNSELSTQNATGNTPASTQCMVKAADTQITENITNIHVAENLSDVEIAETMGTVTDIAEKMDMDTHIAGKENTDAHISEKVNTVTQLAEQIHTDTETLEKESTGTQIAENIHAQIAETVNIDVQNSEKVNSDIQISEKVVTDAEIAERIGAAIADRIDTDAKYVDDINSEIAEKDVSVQIPQKFDPISQIAEKLDNSSQCADKADMDIESGEKGVTDTQIADSVIKLAENNIVLVESETVDASMEETLAIQATDTENVNSLPVLGASENSGNVPLLSDDYVASLSGDIQMKKKDLEKKSTVVQVIPALILEISAEAQGTSAKIQEISAKASNENNIQKEKLFLSDESISNQPMPSEEVNTVEKNTEVHENSEANAKSEIPEFKLKRSRGRPRKIRLEEVPPQINTENEADEKPSGSENKTPEEDSRIQSPIEENRLSGGWRKSERVKKRKLAEEKPVEEPKVEIPKKEETTLSTPVIRTGKRGRPRKYPLQDSDTNSTVIDDDTLKPSETETPRPSETEVADDNLRKFSRKGRPRKCVRYADLNSGIESSESLDGLNSGASVKDKPDDTVVVKEVENVQEAYEKEKQEKVLPLKKRKQRRSKKDESVDENASQKQDSESFSPELKRIKISDDVENEKTVIGGRVLRTRKATSKKYADDYEMDDPLDKDYIEKEVNSESEELYDLLERNESSTRRWNSQFNRKLAAKIAIVTGGVENELFSHSKNVLLEFKPKKYMWKLLTSTDYYNFLPPLKKSVHFKIEKSWNNNETVWSSLDCFDSLPVDKKSPHVTFFTGGPILSSAWCPAPADSTQYIAVAVSNSMNKFQSYLCTDSEKGLIQLWSFGHLTNKLQHPKPVLELLISHNHGFIADMVWCPFGCWENPTTESTDEFLPRLGMLAVSCSDSYIRIYSIPHPSNLPKGSTCFSMYSPSPYVLLKPLYGGECMATRKSMCVCVAWQKTNNCERIAGGYGNGMICIWRINSSATILTTKEKDQTIISPYLIFNAHGTPVTSVSFASLSGARFLVSSSTDKTLKFWDLFDTSLPFFTVRKGASRYAEWTPSACGALVSLDHGMSSLKGASFFKECGTENTSSRTCAKPCCSIRRSSYSEWINSQALADVSGEVSVSFLNGLMCGEGRGALFFCRPVYQAKVKFIEGEIQSLPVLNDLETSCSTSVIKEMQDIVNAVDTMIEKCDTTLNLTTLKNPNQAQSFHPKKLRKKRRRSELEVEECLSESTEVSRNCLEVNDIVSLVTDTKDIVSIMNHLVKNVQISTTLYNIVEEVRRAERKLEISNILNNIVTEATKRAVISDVLHDIVSEVRQGEEISNILYNIVTEVRQGEEVSSVLNNIVAEVTSAAEISDILCNIVTEAKHRAEISDVLNSIVAEVKHRAEISDVLNSIVAEVKHRAEISDVLNSIVAEVKHRAEISDVLNSIVAEVKHRAEISDVLSTIIADVKYRAEISDVLSTIVAEVKYRAEISDVLSTIVAEVRHRAEIFDVLNNLVIEVKNKAENDAQISDVLNNIVAEVTNRSDISNVLSNIVAEITSRTQVSDVLYHIVEQVKHRAEISSLLNNIVAEVRNRSENETEISNVLNNIVAEVENRADKNVEISNVLNNIVAEISALSLQNKRLKKFPKIPVEKDFIIKVIPEMPDSIRCLRPIANTLSNNFKIELSTNSVPDDFVLQTEHSAADCEIVQHNENMVEKTKCDEVLRNFQTEYRRNDFLEECTVTSNAELSEECSEASVIIRQSTDLIGLISDIKDLICIVAELTSNDALPPQLLSVFEVDQLQEIHPDLTSINNYMEQLKNYPEILSQFFDDYNTENSASLTISNLLYSLVRKVSERIASHPETRKLSDGVSLKDSCCEENLRSFKQFLRQNKDCTFNSGLLKQCLEMRDLVGLVADMKDVVTAVSQLTTDSDKGVEKKVSSFDSPLLLNKQNADDPNENFNCLLLNHSSQIVSDIICKIVKTVDKLANHSDGNLCNGAMLTQSSVMKTLDQMDFCGVETIQDDKRIDSELPHSCSEMLDIVNIVADVKDVVSTATQLSSGSGDSVRNEIFHSELNASDLPPEIPTLQREQELAGNPCLYVSKENGECEVVSEEIFNILQDLIEKVDIMTEKVSCVRVEDMEYVEATDMPLMDKFKVCVALEPDLASNTLDSSQLLELSAFGDISCSETFNELTSVDSPSCPPMLTACNNYVPQIVHEESMDNEPPDLRNETDDQTLLPVDVPDIEGSSSENEMDTDDEMDDYLFERESNFSDDSYLSECSLDPSSSISFSSGESIISESSSSPVPDEQDMMDSNLPPSNQNNTCESENSHSQIPSSIYSLVSDSLSNLPTTENLDKGISSTVLECTKLVSVSPVENLNVEKSINKLEKNVPESAMDSSESFLEPILLSNCETISEDSVNNSKRTSVSPNCIENFELVMEQVTIDSACNSLPNVNTDNISSQQSGQSPQADNSLCVNTSSGIQHSSTSSETVPVDRYKEPCAVNIESSSTDCNVLAESTPQNIPECLKRNIFVSEAVPSSSCTNSNSVEVLDESTKESADIIPVLENCSRFSNKRLLTYENVIAEYGLVFKDMNTANFESIEDISEESVFPPLDMYHLASINTVSWNPNYGSHLWLFSAGQSGIARLSYISEINRERYFRRN